MANIARYWPDIEQLFSFGGGTILASRWGHRQSRDIDILAAKNSGVRRALETTLADEFVSLCEKAGAREIEFLPFTATVTVQFPEGDWDLSEIAPPLPGQESLTRVDGVEIRALSSAQILAGKLINRIHEGLCRDIFDLAVAIKVDTAAFKQAVGLLSAAETKLLIQEVRELSASYRKDAPSAIRLTDPKFADIVLDAPEAVANALERQLEVNPVAPENSRLK